MAATLPSPPVSAVWKNLPATPTAMTATPPLLLTAAAWKQLRATPTASPATPPLLLTAAAWKKFLPPGFRNGHVIKWLFSTLGYAALISIGLGLEVENAGTLELILNRICFTMCGLLIVLFNGNYLDIQKYFILTKNPKRWVRWFGMVVVDVALLALSVIVLDILVSVLIR